ncbi:MAG: pectate lyase, partial [Muribaculaceae bacterium]|nr:pectate lyase [Muribaculaceae bacterium]
TPAPDPDPVPAGGKVVCDFSAKAPSSNLCTVSGNYATNKGTATYDGKTYGTCLKMETATSVSFAIANPMKLTLVFADGEAGSVKVNGTKITSETSLIATDLEAGDITLTKANTCNLFLIILE